MNALAMTAWQLPISPDKLSLVIVAFVAALMLAILFTPTAMRLARVAGVLDHPHARRVHTRPTPRWGGLAMYAAFALTVLLVMPLRAPTGSRPTRYRRVESPASIRSIVIRPSTSVAENSS